MRVLQSSQGTEKQRMATSADLAAPVGGLGDGGANGTGKVRARNGGANNNGPAESDGTVAVAEAGDGGGVALADRKASPAWHVTDPLALRLMRAQSDVSTLTQDAVIKGYSKKTGKEYTYKGITSAQIVTRAKEALVRNGVLFWPQLDKVDVKIEGNQTAVYLTGLFVNVDDKTDTMLFGAWGSDADDAGKGYMKALTNANKQVLTKALMMSTVEDETEQDTQHEAVSKPAAVKAAEALTDVAIKTWADAYKSALDGCKTLQQLKQVRAENAPMMNNPGIPQVTKTYFIDKITALEGTLE